jgi:hypothetical protein
MTVATQPAVVYATQSKILRRMVIPDDDAQLERRAVPPGEGVLRMQLDRPHDESSCRAAIAAATGVVPPSGRCCAVDESGAVIAVCNADPALDAHPPGWLVASEQANPGDRHAGGVFLRESRVAPT